MPMKFIIADDNNDNGNDDDESDDDYDHDYCCNLCVFVPKGRGKRERQSPNGRLKTKKKVNRLAKA